MSGIYTSIHQLIGRTPLLELTNLEKQENLRARLLAKLELFNPGGSSKDRIALAMILDAEARGLLKPGSTIIEPTSGNTGLGLALVAVARGYKCILVMPDSMSLERQILMGAYGARLVLTPGKDGMSGAIAKAEELAREIPDSFLPDQFANPANSRAHYLTTGPEIWEDTEGYVDIFVAGVGTGGTITGTGQYLKEKNPQVRIVAVEPEESSLLSGGKAGCHSIQGIGPDFVPKILNREIYDEVLPVSFDKACEAGRRLGNTEGILTGISSGAALCGALEVAKRPENDGKTVVVLLPDTGERYLSTALFRA